MTTIIGISGCHCTGKTTMVNELAEWLRANNYTVCVVDEVARDCPFPIHENGNIDSQHWINDELGHRLNQAKKEEPDYIITDRTFVDSAVYLKCTQGADSQARSFRRKCQKQQEYWYDRVYVSTAVLPLEDDGFRNTNETFWVNVYNEMYWEFVYAQKPPTYIIDSIQEIKERELTKWTETP